MIQNTLRCIFIFFIAYVPGLSAAENKELTAQMHQLPKNELHLHIGGAWPIDYLEEIATPEQFKKLNALLDQIERNELDYHQAFTVFVLLAKIVNSESKIENGVARLCQNLAADNVRFVELRTGLKDLGNGFESHLKAVLRGMERGANGLPLTPRLLLSLRRDSSSSVAEATIDLALKYRDSGIAGIDVSGDSTIGDGRQIFAALKRAKANGLPITLHIGESPDESPLQQMLELNNIQPERVGHAVYLCKEAYNFIVVNKIPIEMCLTSAFKAGMVKEPGHHPVLPLLLSGHPVAICTDDPLIFRCSLSQEFALASILTGLSVEEIARTQESVQSYAFGIR